MPNFVIAQNLLFRWCLRKTTLRAYVDMLRYQEEICGHRFFTRAAHAIIQVYLTIFDKPAEEQNGGDTGVDGADDLSKLSAKERRALKKRQKRAAAKAKKREEAEAKRIADEKEAAKAKESSTTANATSEAAKANNLKESIPDGTKLAEDPDPLGAAMKMVKKLQQHARSDINTHLAALEVFSRKGRYLLVLQALKRGLKIVQENDETMPPTMHFYIVQLARVMRKDIPKTFPQEKINPIVEHILEKETKDIKGFPEPGEDLKKYNDTFLKSHSDSLSHRLLSARVRMELGANAAAACDAVFSGADGEKKIGDIASDLEASVKVYEFVKGLKLPDKLETLRAVLAERHPLTPDFKLTKTK